MIQGSAVAVSVSLPAVRRCASVCASALMRELVKAHRAPYGCIKSARDVQSVHIFTIKLQYSQLRKLSVGPINYAEDEDGNLLPLVLCKEQYRKSSVEPLEKTYEIDSEVETGKRRMQLLKSHSC